MPLPLTDAERAMLHALAAPIDGARRPEFLTAVTTGSRLQVPPRSGQAFCIGLRAQSCVISGIRRRISVRGVSGLEALVAPRQAGRLAPKNAPKSGFRGRFDPNLAGRTSGLTSCFCLVICW